MGQGLGLGRLPECVADSPIRVLPYSAGLLCRSSGASCRWPWQVGQRPVRQPRRRAFRPVGLTLRAGQAVSTARSSPSAGPPRACALT